MTTMDELFDGSDAHELCGATAEIAPESAEGSSSQPVKARPVLFGDVCMNDVDELRDMAEYFDQRRVKSNGDFLREVANRYEMMIERYSTAGELRDAAWAFFAWANKTWPNPGCNESHPWNRLAAALGPHDAEVAIKA